MPEVSAHHMVDTILFHPRGGLDVLLGIAGRQEKDWLEFKSAIEPSKDRPDEARLPKGLYAWHLARSLVAMANSVGGLLVLGLDDQNNPVSLEISDPQNFLVNKGQDAFMRHVVEERIFPESGEWHIGNGKKVSVNSRRLRLHVTPRMAMIRDKKVVVFMVKPITNNDDLLLVEETSPPREYIPVRPRGDVGRVDELFTQKTQSEWKASREMAPVEFQGMLETFLKGHGEKIDLKRIGETHAEPEARPELLREIIRLMEKHPEGLSIHNITDRVSADNSMDRVQDQLVLLSRQGLVNIVRGHLWRLSGMFPAHPSTHAVIGDMAGISRWADFRKLVHYYIDCNMASGDKGLVLWANRENNGFQQLADRLDWEALFCGEYIHLPDTTLAAPLKAGLGDDAACYLCGPLYNPGEGRPFLPIFINPCIVRWFKKEEIVGIALTGPPELNEEWINRVASSPEKRRQITETLLPNEFSDDEGSGDWQPPRTMRDLYRDLPKLFSEDQFVEPLCLSRPDPTDALDGIKKKGYYNRIILVTQKASIYTGRLLRELRQIASASDGDLDRTALISLLPNIPAAGGAMTTAVQEHQSKPLPQLQLLSPDQHRACGLASTGGITVITGPPGTGKSRVVANVMAQALLEGRSVLFSSRNHEALNAVVPYLNEFSKGVPLCGRLSLPYQDNAPDPLAEILHELFNNTTAADPKVRDEYQSVLFSLAQAQADLQKAHVNLEQTSRQFEETDQLTADAEQCLAEIGAAGEVVRKTFRELPSTGDLKRFLGELDRLPIPAGPRPVQFVVGIMRMFKLRMAIRRVRATLEKMQSMVSLKPYAGDLQLIGSPAADLSRRRELLEFWIRVCDAANLMIRAMNARAGLERLEAVDKIQQRIAHIQEVLCKLSRQAVSLRARAAGHAMEGKHIEAIDKLRSSLKRGISANRLQAMARKIFPDLLQYLPLWAVSNLSVGRYLPLAPGVFDLLVVDEASQCDIASVIPLLYRARRVMVVGDRQQLRFVSGLSRGMNERLRYRYKVEDSERFDRYDCRINSFFDLANGSASAGIQNRVLLRDHYRCHAGIANYFNRTFYNEALFINTDETKLKLVKGERPGICWTQVPADARAANGGGAVSDGQIKAICDELRRLADAKYPGTVGVVSPFRRQADRIRDAANEMFASNPPHHWDFRSDTADGFQGGERDIILFSLVGGPDMPSSCGWFYEQDPNRFNVAVSRARAMLRVFGDREWALSWSAGHDSRKHIQLLAGYPDSNEVHEESDPLAGRPPHPPVIGDPDRIGPVWEPKLAQALWDMGIPVQQQYPACGRYLDMALIRQGFKLGIEVDGEAYHRDASGNRKADDIQRDIVLIANGWHVKRFWVYQLRESWDQCVNEIKRFWENNGKNGAAP